MRYLVLAIIAAAVLAVAGPAAAEPIEIGFGIISTETPRDMKERWTPFLADMARQTGFTIRPVFARHYDGIINAVKDNKVQVAHLGNKAAIAAVDGAAVEVFAQVILDGTPGYWSYLVVRADSAIITLDDVLNYSGRYRFGTGDRESTSGTLVPAYYLFAPNRIDPSRHFTRVIRGSHGDNLQAVLTGSVDVATSNSTAFQLLTRKAPDQAALLRILWHSPLIPSDPLVWRRDLPEPVKAVLRRFFLRYGQEGRMAERQVLFDLKGWTSFRGSSNDQLRPVRELDLFVSRREIESDDRLAPEEKSVRLAGIDARLAALTRARPPEEATGISRIRH